MMQVLHNWRFCTWWSQIPFMSPFCCVLQYLHVFFKDLCSSGNYQGPGLNLAEEWKDCHLGRSIASLKDEHMSVSYVFYKKHGQNYSIITVFCYRLVCNIASSIIWRVSWCEELNNSWMTDVTGKSMQKCKQNALYTMSTNRGLKEGQTPWP